MHWPHNSSNGALQTTPCRAAALGAKDDSQFRHLLAQKDKHFALVRDTAKAQKHAVITKTASTVSTANQVVARGVGYGEGGYGQDRFGDPVQAIATTNAGELKYLEEAADGACNFIEQEMKLQASLEPSYLYGRRAGRS